jgi:hypothetical protein
MARPWTMVLPGSTSRYAGSNPDQPIFADLLLMLDDSDPSSLNLGYGNYQDPSFSRIPDPVFLLPYPH